MNYTIKGAALITELFSSQKVDPYLTPLIKINFSGFTNYMGVPGTKVMDTTPLPHYFLVK